MNPLTVQLYQAWVEAVRAGEVVNQFTAPQDDAAGRWSAGEQVIYGLCWAQQECVFYAHNLSRDQAIYDAIEERCIGDAGLICQFNGYRSLRPGSQPFRWEPQPPLSAAAADCRFFCQAPERPLSLASRRPLMRIELTYFVWHAYYNAAPVEPAGHFLWIPARADQGGLYLPHLPQRLTWELLHDALSLFNRLDETILFFNGLNAGASVNHIHLQSIRHRQALPVETAPLELISSCSLLKTYPVRGFVFDPRDSCEKIYSYIESLQDQGIPFNLVMIGNRAVLFPRGDTQGWPVELPPLRPAALGMAGKLITASRAVFDSLNLELTARIYERTELPKPQFLQLIEET